MKKKINFKKKGKLINFVVGKELIKIPLSSIFEGVNTMKNYFIKKENKKIVYIIDRICDHNGGKLINKKDLAICPLHGWELNLKTLKYNDSMVCKEKVNFKINKKNEIEFYANKYILKENYEKK